MLLSEGKLVSIYSALCFDFDGTLADTNEMKRDAIYEAVLPHCNSEQTARRFTQWFINRSGIAREIKVGEHFESTTARLILDSYATILKMQCANQIMDAAALKFVHRMAWQGLRMNLVSGGSVGEIRSVLSNSGCSSVFEEILGSPTDKVSHLLRLKEYTTGKALFFGDSPYDSESCHTVGVDFCYVEKLSCFAPREIPYYRYRIYDFRDII